MSKYVGLLLRTLGMANAVLASAWLHGQCGTTVYDTGGPGGNYGILQNLTWTYCAPPGQVLTITFTAFNTEAGFDELSIHDGPTNGGPMLGIFSGTTLPGSFTSSPGGCLTLWFTSDFTINAAGWAANITCAPAPPPPAGDCVYQLEMFDSFGDGWDGSTVGISINGGPFTPYTIGGAYGSVLIGVNIGDVIVVQYTEVSPWPGEISFTLGFYGATGVYASGSPPPTGIVFTQTIDCNPPPASSEDCIGAITICGSQSFNNNQIGTGDNVDLNSANYGCLSSAERQGTWYVFSPSAGGNVAFTITASATTDYDFAIWGPYPPGSNPGTVCPPAAPPIRCSYSALYGNTGLNYTAVDNSEDALGDKWVNDLTVTTGQVYLLYVSNWSQDGLTFGLNWNLTNGASLDCTVLPVELLTLEADAVDDHVAVHWVTASETASDHFVVERSTDNSTFLPIGYVDAAGNTIEQTHYNFSDQAPASGLNYYRLRQVDVDGSAEPSQVVSVRFMPAGVLVGDPYPVPTAGDVAIDIDGSIGTGTVLRAIDHLGRPVYERVIDIGDGITTVVVPSTLWSAGVYALEVRRADGTLIKQVRWVKR